MKLNNTLATVEKPQAPAAPSSSMGFLGLRPKEMVSQAAEIATILADIIKKQNLSSNIRGKEHVKVEGWATLGTLLGILPREKYSHELPDGSFEACVELYSVATGQIVGMATALCGMDEERWKKAERYARRSMAVTRATGKAYRLGFGWIMALSGYQSTPAEEMPIEAEIVKTEPVPVYSKKDPEYVAWAERGLAHYEATPYKDKVLEILEGQPMGKDTAEDLIAAIKKAKDLEG